jgi:hypothetical protein
VRSAAICSGSAVAGRSVDRRFRAIFAQDGGSVTATADVDHAGAVCNYTGSLQGSTLVLNATGCTPAKAVAVRCPDGARDIEVKTQTLRVTIDGDRMTGTAEETDTITISGTSTVVAILVGTASILLLRQ